MALTVTNIIASQNISVGAYPTQATKLALQSTTNAYSVSVQITAGNALPANRQGQWTGGSLFRLYHITSPISVTTAAAPGTFQYTARPLEYRMPFTSAAESLAWETPAKLVQGGFLYVWFDFPNVSGTVVLDVNVVEITV
jgi:hypothetical protein